MGYHGISWASMESHSKTMGNPPFLAGFKGLWITLLERKFFSIDSQLSQIADNSNETRSTSVPGVVDLGSHGM
jgi:hypothetical protein